MAFSSVYGPPFVREGEVRRDASMDDFQNFTRLSELRARLGRRDHLRAGEHAAGLAPSRDMTFALQTLNTDKIYMGNVVSG